MLNELFVVPSIDFLKQQVCIVDEIVDGKRLFKVVKSRSDIEQILLDEASPVNYDSKRRQSIMNQLFLPAQLTDSVITQSLDEMKEFWTMHGLRNDKGTHGQEIGPEAAMNVDTFKQDMMQLREALRSGGDHTVSEPSIHMLMSLFALDQSDGEDRLRYYLKYECRFLDKVIDGDGGLLDRIRLQFYTYQLSHSFDSSYKDILGKCQALITGNDKLLDRYVSNDTIQTMQAHLERRFGIDQLEPQDVKDLLKGSKSVAELLKARGARLPQWPVLESLDEFLLHSS